MPRPVSPRRLAALAALALALIILPAHAAGDPTDGHTHADEAATTAASGPPIAEADGSQFEAVLELAGDHMLIWVDDRETTAPAPAGTRLTVTVGERDLAVQEIEPGTFRADLAGPHTEPFVVALAVEAPTGADLLEATLRPAPAGGDHHHPLDWRSAAIGAGAVLLMLLLFGAAGALRRRRATATATTAIAILLAAGAAQPLWAAGDPTDGHTHGDEAPGGAGMAGNRPHRLGDGQLFLPKPSQRIMGVRTFAVAQGTGSPTARIAGRVVADPSRSAEVATARGGRLEPVGSSFPRVGQLVRAGEPLLAARPALDAGAAQASASMLQSLDRDIALAHADYRRLGQLEGVVARAEIERARLTLAGLRAQRAAAARPVEAVEVLRAPIAGRVARVSARLGMLTAPGQRLLEIEGSTPALVEAAAPAGVAGRVIRSAEATTANGVRVPLRLVGRSPGLEGGVEQVQFAPLSGGGVLRTGETVTLDLLLAATGAQQGLVVPARALVRDGGTPVLFVKMSPTRFEPRVVRTRPLAGGALLVEAGLAPGDRVVTDGAALLAQVR